MRSKLFGVAAASVAALLIWSTFDTAEARRGGGFRSGGHFHGGGFRSPGAGMRFHGGGYRSYGYAPRRGLYYAAPFAAWGGYYGYYGGGGGCQWLKQRAAYTGSRYWWNRYYACINGY